MRSDIFVVEEVKLFSAEDCRGRSKLCTRNHVLSRNLKYHMQLYARKQYTQKQMSPILFHFSIPFFLSTNTKKRPESEVSRKGKRYHAASAPSIPCRTVEKRERWKEEEEGTSMRTVRVLSSLLISGFQCKCH